MPLLQLLALIAAAGGGIGFVPTVPENAVGGVPTNPLLLVNTSDFLGLGVELIDAGRAVVSTTSTVVPTQDSTAAVRLTLAGPLRPQARYTLHALDDELADPDLAFFVTGDGPDDDAPAAPLLAVESVSTSGGFGEAIVTVDTDDDVPVVDIEGGGTRFLEGIVNVSLRLAGTGTVTFSIVALDHAGNTSDPTSIDVDFDGGCGGCASSSSSSSSSSPALPVALLAVWLANGRRRRA